MAKIAYTPEQKVHLQALIKQIAKEASEADMAFQISASETMTTATIHSNKVEPVYKKELVQGGQEFVYHHARLGAKGQFIFSFRPMDMQKWSHVEIEAPKVFDTFPRIVEVFKNAPGFAMLGTSVAPNACFNGCIAAYLVQIEEQEKARLKALADAEEVERLANLSSYDDNPECGMF